MRSGEKLDLQKYLLACLDKRKACALKYVAFDDDVVYEVLNRQPRQLGKRGIAGCIDVCALFHEEVSDWWDNLKRLHGKSGIIY